MTQPSLTIIIAVAVIAGAATMLIMRGRARPPGTPQHGAPSFTTGVVIVAVSLILTVLLSAGYTTYAVQQSQHKWCDTLNLLTEHPVPRPADPAANPSRAQNYLYYTTFLTLKGRFGC